MKEINNLYNVIKDRKNNPREGSYTTYLFEKGIEKILKKYGEESIEVVIASLKDSKEDIILEVGDVLYHLMVLLVEKGITLEEIDEEIYKRSLKTNNLKAERKPIENL
ncbi:MAG: phosphoribosyl-ATP diphosphatase [Erysipelotrichaceae bacterium]|nr:phosphoribosyl-ATP diphosphatase [Erysipelotrichaceae bacterium]